MTPFFFYRRLTKSIGVPSETFTGAVVKNTTARAGSLSLNGLCLLGLVIARSDRDRPIR